MDASAGSDLVLSCGWNTRLGRLRENASTPLARLTVSRSGLLTLASPTAPSVTLGGADVLDVVPMRGISWSPLKSPGLAIRRSNGDWDYVWCRGTERDEAAAQLLAAGFPVREQQGGVWVWRTVFGAGRPPR